MYVDPQYLPPEPQDLPPEYNEDEVPVFDLDEEDRTNQVLKDLDITSYDNVDKITSQPEMTPKNKRKYLNKVLHNARHRRSQLPGYKTQLKTSI